MYFIISILHSEAEVHRGEGLIKEEVYGCLAPGHQHTTPYIVIEDRQEEGHRKIHVSRKIKQSVQCKIIELEWLHVQLWVQRQILTPAISFVTNKL